LAYKFKTMEKLDLQLALIKMLEKHGYSEQAAKLKLKIKSCQSYE